MDFVDHKLHDLVDLLDALLPLHGFQSTAEPYFMCDVLLPKALPLGTFFWLPVHLVLNLLQQSVCVE